MNGRLLEKFHGKSPEQLSNDIHSISLSEMKTLFSIFLKSSSYARSLLALHTEHLKEKFALLDKATTTRLSNELNNEKNGNTHPCKLNNKNKKLVNIRTTNNAPSIPGWVLSSPGQYEYVVINYFTYTIWWDAFTYGEQDVIYNLYSGSAAQNYYNSISSQLSTEEMAEGAVVIMIAGIITPAATIAGVAISSDITKTITILAAGIGTALGYGYLSNAYYTIYESDYANHNSGDKYMFLYETSDYYYPWYVYGAQASSFGVNGILSDGNTNTIIPNQVWLQLIPGGPAVYAQYVSNCCNNFGTGQWKYVGSS